MATYEYICLSCERPFEQRRPMSSGVQTELTCPACGSERVRRRFSFMAGPSSELAGGGGCACGGACACGH